MSQFFIERPVFAWVIAIFIAVAGIVAIPQLPVARFPDVAPPSISIFATYSGADVQTVSDSVIRPIEKELASVKNVLYYESSVDSTGGADISVTFKPGTDPEMAQVDVQNRLKNADAVLPEQVRRSGVSVEASESDGVIGVPVAGVAAPFKMMERGPCQMATSIERKQL